MMGEYNHHLSKTHTCVCSSMAEEGHKPCSAIAVRHPFLYYSGYDTAEPSFRTIPYKQIRINCKQKL